MKEEHVADLVIEALVRFSRERMKITAIELDTDSYLRAAHSLGASTPGVPLRLVPIPVVGGTWVNFNQSVEPDPVDRTPLIRIGPSFVIAGPRGMVTIREKVTDEG